MIVPYADNTTVTSGPWWTLLEQVGVNLNSTSTVTNAIDTLALDKPRQTASLQVLPESGAHTTHVVAVYGSFDQVTWTEIASSAATGSACVFNIVVKGVPFIRAKVKTAEGGASTGTIRLLLVNDNN